MVILRPLWLSFIPDGPLEHYLIPGYEAKYFMTTGDLETITVAMTGVITPAETAVLPCPYALGGPYSVCVEVSYLTDVIGPILPYIYTMMKAK